MADSHPSKKNRHILVSYLAKTLADLGLLITWIMIRQKLVDFGLNVAEFIVNLLPSNYPDCLVHQNDDDESKNP